MSRGPIIDTGLVDALRGGMQGGISLASLLSHIEDQKRQAEMEHQRLLMDQAWRQSQESIQKDRNAIDREQLAETARGHDLQALDREADNKRAEGVIKDRQQQYQEKRTDQTNANRSTLAMAGVQPTTTAMMPFGGAGTGLPTMPMPVQQDNPEYQQGLMADPQILAQQMKDQIEEVRRQSKVAKGVNLLNRAHQNKMPAYMVAMRDDMGNPVPLDTYLAGLGHPLEPEDVNPHAREAYLRGIDMMGPSAYSVMGSGKAPPAAMMKPQAEPFNPDTITAESYPGLSDEEVSQLQASSRGKGKFDAELYHALLKPEHAAKAADPEKDPAVLNAKDRLRIAQSDWSKQPTPETRKAVDQARNGLVQARTIARQRGQSPAPSSPVSGGAGAKPSGNAASAGGADIASSARQWKAANPMRQGETEDQYIDRMMAALGVSE